jgi:hypothetical protein
MKDNLFKVVLRKITNKILFNNFMNLYNILLFFKTCSTRSKVTF